MAASGSEFHRCALAFTDYENFLSRWRSACGDARIRVTCFENLRDDPHGYMRSLAVWLGIEPDFYDEFDFSVLNRNVAVRSRAAQKVVHRLSPLLGTPARNLGRRVYRRMNTKSLSQPSPDDRALRPGARPGDRLGLARSRPGPGEGGRPLADGEPRPGENERVPV